MALNDYVINRCVRQLQELQSAIKVDKMICPQSL